MTTTTGTDAGTAIETAARRLLQAHETRTPCAPIRDLLADRTPEAQLTFGYQVQRILTQHSLDNGRRIIGSKIGLTSQAVQKQLGVDQPDLGVLFADMARDEHTPIDPGELLQPKIEAEIAFILAADLDRPDLDLDTVRAAVESVIPALEIVDSRVAGWDIRLVDTVADNASCGLYVLGADRRPLTALDLPALTMNMTGAGGRVVSTGSGAACMGDPCAALLWLARTAQRFGAPLKAGDVVLSGALGPMVQVAPGITYISTIEGLGSVQATFGATA